MTATKIQPGDDTHLTLLMAPHSLNLVTGADRAALLAYGRDVFAAARASQCLAQIEEPVTLAGTTIEQYARMFNAACEALGRVSDCLGINSDIEPGAEPITAAIEQLRAGKTHPVLDDRWKARILDGRAIERDEMGLGDHPELPLLDEGMMPRSFFAALGLELAHTSAEDQLDGEVLGAMSEAVNWTDWLPIPPHDDGWKLVSIFDTEDGPVAWWLRELPEAEDGTTTIRILQAEVEKLKARIARAGAAPAAVAGPAIDRAATLAAIDDISEPSWTGYECPNTWADGLSAARAVVQSAPAAPALEAPVALEGWREQFSAAVYDDLAAADNQDVPLEEYPARILKVLDAVVGPRHPAVILWRNDAIQACIAIAYKYCRDPESFQYLKQDLQGLVTAVPKLAAAPKAPVAPVCEDCDDTGTVYDGKRVSFCPTECAASVVERQADAAAPAAPAVDAQGERDAAFEAVRNRLCSLQRYSFVLDDDGIVRRAHDRTGSWIEFDDAHALFDPVAVDAAIAAQAKEGGAPVADAAPLDVCTDPYNCARCKTHPAHRGDMHHAGISRIGGSA